MKKVMDDMASREWASRPDDQRFASIDELRAYLQRRREASWELPVKAGRIPLEATDDGNLVIDVAGLPQCFTHWSFGQTCALAGAPAAFLRKLPATMTRDILRYQLGREPERERMLYLSTENGEDKLMAMTSGRYDRFYDVELLDIVERLEAAAGGGFFTPPAHGGKPSGLYASAQDVFIFRVDGGSRLLPPSRTSGEVFRNICASHSEVGARRLRIRTGWHDEVCGNHFLFGFEEAFDVSIVHVGDVRQKITIKNPENIVKWLKRPATDDQAMLKAATSRLLPAGTTPELAEWMFKRWKTPEKTVERFVEKAVEQEGDCRTFWQLASGVTRYARDLRYADSAEPFQELGGELILMASSVSPV